MQTQSIWILRPSHFSAWLGGDPMQKVSSNCQENLHGSRVLNVKFLTWLLGKATLDEALWAMVKLSMKCCCSFSHLLLGLPLGTSSHWEQAEEMNRIPYFCTCFHRSICASLFSLYPYLSSSTCLCLLFYYRGIFPSNSNHFQLNCLLLWLERKNNSLTNGWVRKQE